MLTIEGTVIPGDQRGRQLGFPTANIDLTGQKIAPEKDLEGVWAGLVEINGLTQPATVSIGRRPTFYADEGQLLLEAYLLDFNGDLYGTTVKVHLTDFIRGQFKFSSLDSLITCMNSDVAKTRELLSVLGSPSEAMMAGTGIGK